jgi:hypothetical protein
MAVAEVRQCWGTIGPMEAVGGLPPEFARPGPAARSGFRPARARNDGARDERRSAPIFRDGTKRPQGSPDRCRRASVSGAAQAGSPIASVGRASGLKAAAAAGLSRHLTGVTGCPCSRQVFQGRDEHRQRHLGWSKERIAASSTVLTRRAGERDGSWKRPPPTAKPQRNIPPARDA